MLGTNWSIYTTQQQRDWLGKAVWALFLIVQSPLSHAN